MNLLKVLATQRVWNLTQPYPLKFLRSSNYIPFTALTQALYPTVFHLILSFLQNGPYKPAAYWQVPSSTSCV